MWHQGPKSKSQIFIPLSSPNVRVIPPGWKVMRFSVAFSLALMIFFALYEYRITSLIPRPPSPGEKNPGPYPELHLHPDIPTCGNGLDPLKIRKYDISSRVIYGKRCLRPVFSQDWDREVVHNLSSALIPTSRREISLKDCNSEEMAPHISPCNESNTIDIQVSYPYPQRQYPEFLFAVATSMERLRKSQPEFIHWLANTGARLVSTIVGNHDEFTDEELRNEEEKWAREGIDLACIRQRNESDTVNQVHFVMIEDLVDQFVRPETKWIGVLDDDTFFPSIYPLAKALEIFDPSKFHYIGQTGEEFSSIKRWGFNAFGGAGIFITIPLAKQLAPIARGCLTEETSRGGLAKEGDVLFAECIYHHTKAKLEILRGLWQMDIHGNPDGFFESGTSIISMHHWKTWMHVPVRMMSLLSNLCGNCMLARWRAGDNEVFSAGYSIAQYDFADGSGNRGLNLDKMEHTFRNNGDMSFSIGPLRPAVHKTEKRSWKLRHSELDRDGNLSELYINRGNRTNGEIEDVIEIVWLGGRFSDAKAVPDKK